MKKLDDTHEIVGGQNITGPIINGIVNLFTAIYKIGQGMGGAIRRISTGNVCPL